MSDFSPVSGTTGSTLVGAPIVEFHHWHPLKPDFVGELTRRLGGRRCGYFWSHL